MKVSVIIPVYKVEKYLDECVASVVNQTYRNLEIILVNDGSPDNCPAMCDTWAEKDERIKVVHKKNGGLSDARNAGLDVSTGEYILFLDSDDTIIPTAVEELISVSQKTDADIVIFKLYRNLEEGGKGTGEMQIVPKEEAMVRTVRKTNYITACSKLYRKKVFGQLRFEKGRLHEDEFLCCQTFHEAEVIADYDKALYYYRTSLDSIMTSKPKMKNLVDTMDAIEGRLEFLKEKGYEKAYHANIARLYTGFFTYYPDVVPSNEEERCLKKKYKQRIKSILPQLRNHPQLIEGGYKFIVRTMHISVDFGMWIVKLKRRFL